MNSSLSLQQVSKHFGGVKAVNKCSFDVQPNTITALIGPNGAGKTTVFNLISGILQPDEGKIMLNGHSVTNQSPEAIANAGISRLFQQNRLFSNLTIEENLLLAFDNKDTHFFSNLLGQNKVTAEKKKQVHQMLELVHLEHSKQRKTGELSFGQKRLVELARCLLKPHQFLMLDEPVSGVNPKLRKEIAGILQELRQKKETILLIEHDMDFTLKIADNVIVMDEGKVIAEGKPSEIKNNAKVLEAYLGE